MRPLFFDGCFAWLHGAALPADPARLGVVICGAWAQDEICTRHGLMALGERLAAEGIPTLRFDYRGTADSAAGEMSLQTMHADAVRAVAALRQEAGVGPVALLGLRLGGAVALSAAGDVAGLAGLVLLSPVVTGAAYLREMRAAARVNPLSRLDPVPRAEDALPLNTNGFLWSAALQAELATLDLRNHVPAVVPTLVMQPRPDRGVEALAGTLRAAGVPTEVEGFPGYEAFMRDPTTHETPVAAWERIGAWMAAQLRPAVARPAVALPRADDIVVSDTLVEGGAEEVPLRFGPDEAVFGMLCRPTGAPAAPVAALLLHEGSSHHIGNGGAYVPLARALAEAGFASLRMDLRGFGDSPGTGRNPHYDPERQADVTAAVDLLRRMGYPRFVALGLCSGAHTALQAARGNPGAAGAVIVNLQKFIWHYGDDVRVKPRPMKRSLKSYIRSMGNPGEWRRLLKGDADLASLFKVLALRAVDTVRANAAALLPPKPDSEAAQVREQLHDLSERQVVTHLIFADDDPGLSEIALQFGRGGRRLRDHPAARLTLLPDADHHFAGTSVRRRHVRHVIQAMRDIAASHGAGALRSVKREPADT